MVTLTGLEMIRKQLVFFFFSMCHLIFNNLLIYYMYHLFVCVCVHINGYIYMCMWEGQRIPLPAT